MLDLFLRNSNFEFSKPLLSWFSTTVFISNALFLFMKFIATLVLCLALLVPYYLLSNGTFYLPDDTLSNLAFDKEAGVFNYFSHLLTHVGLGHLLGNILPIIAFGLVLEQVLCFGIIGVFFFSGILSSAVFLFLNPTVILVGASTSVAGLMSAATLLKPKKALFLLFGILLLLFLIPAATSFYNSLQLNSLEGQKTQLRSEVEILLAENKTAEAAQANASLVKVERTFTQTKQGIEREKTTPTDAVVHFLGALFGGVFVFIFYRKQMHEGLMEFEHLGVWLEENLSFIRRR